MKRALEALVAVLIAAVALPAATLQHVPLPPGLDDSEFHSTFIESTWSLLPIAESMDAPTVEAEGALDELEWYEEMSVCMSASANPTLAYWFEDGAMRAYEIDVDGVMTDPTPEAQLDFYRCAVRHPRLLEGSMHFSDERIAYQYEYLKRWVDPCLTAAGYRHMPLLTFNEFVQTRGVWSPYWGELWDPTGEYLDTPAEYEALIEVCGNDFPGVSPELLGR